MKTDCYFEIGSSHESCQDYALTGEKDGIGFAIVTDGCSESHNISGQADLGARVVAYAARKLLMHSDVVKTLSEIDKERGTEFSSEQEKIRDCIMQEVEIVRKHLDLSPLFSDCTLLLTVVDKDKANLFMFGDGVAAIKFKNGDLNIIDVTYLSGAPYYPSYPLDSNRLACYVQEFGGMLDVCQNLQQLNGLRKNASKQINLSPHPSIGWDNTSFTFKDIESISLMSDGVKSYQKQSDNGMNNVLSEDIVNSFVAYKNTSGVFVQRRMKALQKDHKKLLMSHFDDISIATVVV